MGGFLQKEGSFMNHDGNGFWVGRTDRLYLNSKETLQGEERIAENLTYDEARALILSMGGVFSRTDEGMRFESFEIGR